MDVDLRDVDLRFISHRSKFMGTSIGTHVRDQGLSLMVVGHSDGLGS